LCFRILCPPRGVKKNADSQKVPHRFRVAATAEQGLGVPIAIGIGVFLTWIAFKTASNQKIQILKMCQLFKKSYMMKKDRSFIQGANSKWNKPLSNDK